MSRIEWRFSEGSVLSIGHWYLEWGDPERETLLTLTEVIRVSDNPVWCIREHVAVLGRVVGAAEELLDELAAALPRADGSGPTLAADSPMATTVVRAHLAIHHVLALLVDALVECRKGRVEAGLLADSALASVVAFTTADALNCAYRIESLVQNAE